MFIYCGSNLALGIRIQNFPEGLAVSLPLRAAGTGTWTSFWYMYNEFMIRVLSDHFRYGQLSGMVEPLAGVFGVVAMVVSVYMCVCCMDALDELRDVILCFY